MSKFATTIKPEQWVDGSVTVDHGLGRDVIVQTWEQRGEDLYRVEADEVIHEQGSVVVSVGQRVNGPVRVVVMG